MPEKKYYDPVKAHEYYENYTKKGRLKGRGSGTTDGESTNTMSTKGWNDKQKAEFKAANQHHLNL